MVFSFALHSFLLIFLSAPLLASPCQSVPVADLNDSVVTAAADPEKRAEELYQEAIRLMEGRSFHLAHLRLFEAVQIWQQINHTEQAAQALVHLADLDRQSARWQDALTCYRQALQLAILKGSAKATALNVVASLYVSLKQFHFATEYHRQALRLAQQTRDKANEVTALAGLAAVNIEQGQAASALTLLEKARLIAQQVKDYKTTATLFFTSGRAYQRQGQKDKSYSAIEQALTFYDKAGDQEGRILALCLLSDLNQAADQPQAALTQATQALRLASVLRTGETQWRAHLAMARAQRALGQTDEAIKSYYRSYGMVEKQRLVDVSVDAFRVALLSERQAPYRELAGLWVEHGRIDEAFLVIERARARATLDLLAQSRSRETAATPSASAEKLRTLTDRVNRLRIELRSAELSAQQLALRQAELTEALQQLEEVRWEVERPKPFTTPIDLRQTQKLLQPDAVLLEFALGKQQSYVWFITDKEATCAPLPGQQEIEEKVRSYLSIVTTRPSNRQMERAIARQKKSGDEIFRLLLGQFAGKLQAGQQLIVVPDGLLYYLPFGSLVREGRYLIESHTISYAPSASVLNLLRQTGETADVQEQMELLAFGDPVSGSLLKAGNGSRKGTEADAMTGEFWTASRLRFPPLPNTRNEVQAISELFPPDQQRIYLGAKMTEEALKRESLERYRRLHFATHSLIDEQMPSRSGIVMSPGEEAKEDGFLDLAEITALRLNCDLVVLSACRTGRGQLVSGEGVVGLTRAFLYAGTRRVTVSLWDVSDLSTARLMTDFHRHLNARLAPAAALRQAKLEMLARGRAARHPYYWAPFVLVGKQ